MKILILGANGLLGHKLWLELSKNHSVVGTVRKAPENLRILSNKNRMLIENVDMWDRESIATLMTTQQPDIVINAVGIIKQRDDAHNEKESTYINAQLPHLLADLCLSENARFIHFSTDCVFNGSRGDYIEIDSSDAEDLYGKTKFAGETTEKNTFTMRTSIIGHELTNHASLIDWFLGAPKEVKGFTKAIYTGFPTLEIARILEEFVFPHPELYGMYHVASRQINKYKLLNIVNEIYGKNANITKETNFFMERSLNSERFNHATGFVPKSWKKMVEEMHSDYLKNRELYIPVS